MCYKSATPQRLKPDSTQDSLYMVGDTVPELPKVIEAVRKYPNVAVDQCTVGEYFELYQDHARAVQGLNPKLSKFGMYPCVAPKKQGQMKMM